MLTQQKSSIILGLEQDKQLEIFDLVINAGKSFSIEYYSLLPQFIGQNQSGIIFTVFDDRKDLLYHQRKLQIKFKQTDHEMHMNEIQKQIFNQIQFQKISNSTNSMSNLQDLALIKSLPYSIQQTVLKLFTLLKNKYKPQTSLHLNRQGYKTLCLRTETQFNSIKYVWNFFREQISPNKLKNVKDMQKFENQRGAIFNVPLKDMPKWEAFQNKIQNSKMQKLYKGYKLTQIIGQIPKLQDIQSQEYKKLQLKKEQALRNRAKLQLYISGVPYQMNQVDIRKFFAQKQINLFLVRIVRDSSGFSKGIAFGIAQNQNQYQRAILLNGQKWGDRVLRLKKAEQQNDKQK